MIPRNDETAVWRSLLSLLFLMCFLAPTIYSFNHVPSPIRVHSTRPWAQNSNAALRARASHDYGASSV